MEAAVRWSPHSTRDRQRFLLVDVADQTLALHEVESLTKHGITNHAIVRTPKLPSFSAFNWSKTQESNIAVGHVSGTASLVKFYDDGRPSETAATFRLKQQRKCNSIAFSIKDWLAVGVDKTRSDVCLFVYDVTRDQLAEPIRKLCAAEVVNSVRFFVHQPETLIASTSRAFIRIYDLRDGYSAAGANAQVATKCVNNIAIDPLDEHYFASAGSTDDPSVTIWDRRWMPQTAPVGSNNGAVFEFKPAVSNSGRTTIWSLRYSGQRSGRLAMCSSMGELKVVDTKDGKVANSQTNDRAPQNAYVVHVSGESSWTNPVFGAEDRINLPYVSEEKTVESAASDPKHRDKRLIAFDWVANSSDSFSQQMLALRPNREVGVLTVPSAHIQAEFSTRNDLSLAFDGVSVTEPRQGPQRTTIKALYEQPNRTEPEDFGPFEYSGEGDFDAEDTQLLSSRDSLRVRRLLATSAIYRERCQHGYLFDCGKNSHIVAGNWQLERLWEIVGRFREQGTTMVHNRSNLDLAFTGVKGLWLEDVANLSDRRPAHGKAGKMRDAVVGLNKVNHLPAFEGERTNFPEHRQLCLVLCGWKFTPDTLEAECNELVDRGLYYQAVVQAVLHGYTHTALNLLRSLIRSKTIPNIGLGALLASSEINAEQREMCLWMAADTEDAALKALLAYLVSGDWRDVMKTPYLHLGYRLALGLKYLNDTELSGFIASETARSVRNGDLEGILLTGLAGEQAMDLFQTYITRSGDLQTAVLATAFTHPKYGDDMRWEVWKESYFEQMQRWRCFTQRATFVVQHARMTRALRTGESLIETPGKQMLLRCAHCQGDMSRRSGAGGEGSGPQRDNNAVKIAGPAVHAGTVCPRCGRHLPRCAICKLWLGTTEPRQEKKPLRSSGDREVDGAAVDADTSGATGAEDASVEDKLNDTMRKLLSFCVRCGHGYHAHHAKMWFERHRVCAVAECECLCQT